ncbi:MAG: cytochrome P460 family protein [Hyphomicrobiales bacterium]
MKTILKSTAVLAASLAFGLSAWVATPIQAQDQNAACTFPKAPDDFEQAEIDKLYECIQEDLYGAYAKAGHEIGANLRDWKVTQTGIGPSFAGHGNRFLKTYSNDIAYDEYIKWRDEGGFALPVGSVLAKASWKVSKEGKPQKGPLLIMTKLAKGEADEFGNWLYSGVNGTGKNFKVSQKFCHDCHGVYEDQDSLGYPAEEVRINAE